jgi:protease I
MSEDLNGRRVAVLTANEGIEQIELTAPVDALREAGAEVDLIAPEAGTVQAFNHLDRADEFRVDHSVAEVSAGDYAGLVLPGGVANPDQLRMSDAAVGLISDFFEQGKPVGAICHAPWSLIEADVVDGRRLTSWPSLRTDIRNAGGEWVDEEVCVDEGFVTSRGPDDLEAFCSKVIEEIAEGRHAGQTA